MIHPKVPILRRTSRNRSKVLRCALALAFIPTFLSEPAFARPVVSGPVWESREVELRLADEEQPFKIKIRRPMVRKPGEKFPVVLVFGGFENAARVLDLFTVQKRWVLASFDYPFRGRRPLRFPESILDLREARRMVQLTPRAMRTLIRTIPELEPSADPNRRILVGASLGGPFTVQAAAQLRADELAALVLVHAFGDVQETILASLTGFFQRTLPAYPALASFLGQELGERVWNYLGSPDPVRDAQTLPRGLRVYFLRAENDSRIPERAVDRLEEALKKAPVRLDVERKTGDHLRPGDRAQLQEALEAVDGWLLKQGLVDS